MSNKERWWQKRKREEIKRERKRWDRRAKEGDSSCERQERGRKRIIITNWQKTTPFLQLDKKILSNNNCVSCFRV